MKHTIKDFFLLISKLTTWFWACCYSFLLVGEEVGALIMSDNVTRLFASLFFVGLLLFSVVLPFFPFSKQNKFLRSKFAFLGILFTLSGSLGVLSQSHAKPTYKQVRASRKLRADIEANPFTALVK